MRARAIASVRRAAVVGSSGTYRPRPLPAADKVWPTADRCISISPSRQSDSSDPRIREIGRDIADDFARIREEYGEPRPP